MDDQSNGHLVSIESLDFQVSGVPLEFESVARVICLCCQGVTEVSPPQICFGVSN